MIDFDIGVTLGPLEGRFIPIAQQWRNDPRIWSWCRQFDVISEREQQAWYDAVSVDETIRMYAINTSTPGIKPEFVGVCGLTSIDHVNRRAEFSLYINPEEQRKGYAEKALKTLCLHGFRNLNLNCIWGETFEGNVAVSLFEKLGFKKEGSRREFYYRDGNYIDAHLYSLLARECAFNGAALGAKPAEPKPEVPAAPANEFGTVSFFQAEGPKKTDSTH